MYEPREKPDGRFYDAMQNLSAIGNNINQLAAKAHTLGFIDVPMLRKPNQQEQIKFKREDLKKYFPAGYTDEQMRRDIIKGLELLKRQRERNRDAR